MWLCFSHIYCIHAVTLVKLYFMVRNLKICEDSTRTIYLIQTQPKWDQKAERRQEEQSEEAESCHGNLWKYSWKGHKQRNRHKKKRKVGKLSWFIIIDMSKRYITKTIVFKCNCYVRKQTIQNVPKYGGGGGGGGGSIMRVIYITNNLEGRIKFMIVEINILGLMSPKMRLF